jgi:4-amino-4-deoxy-L-arabinose transferase-like glycosyltransferase
MRMLSVLLMVGVVGLSWFVARELLAREWAVATATGLVALQPKLGFAGGIVNPDVMLALWATGALLAGLRLVRQGPSVGRVAGLLACAGLAVLTHPRGYYLPPFAAIAVLVALWRFRPGWRWAAAAGAAVVVGLVVALAAATAWVGAHTGSVGGGPSGSGSPNIAAGFNARQFLSYLWQFYLPKLSSMSPKVGPAGYGYRQMFIETYFGGFGSFSVDYRPLFYDFMQLLAGLGLAALYTTAAIRWRAVLARWPVVLLSVVFFGGLMALLHLVSYSTLLGTTDPVITGRYLLPAVALYGAAAAWVCASLPRRVGLPGAGVLLGISVLVAVGGIGLSVERFYV